MKVHWDGAKPPTALERRALQRAANRGELRDGDRVHVARVNPAPTAAQDAYTRFHWDRKPKRTRNTRLPNFAQLYELGKLKRVEYETRKGNETAIWVHDFTAPFPSLTATPSGRLGPIVGGRAIVTERGIER